MTRTVLHLDYETYGPEGGPSEVGLERYAKRAEVMLAAYAFDNGPVNLWDYNEGEPLPIELEDALRDPEVEKWAFNAQFERRITLDALGIETPIRNWRCTMVLAYMRSFYGGLDDVGKQIGLPTGLLKMAEEGHELVKFFCGPQKVSKNRPYARQSVITDPDKWERFRAYCVQDVATERAIKQRLLPFPLLDLEWQLYELDQVINDRGKPVDVRFVLNALGMAERRRGELLEEMRDLTGVENPNSPAQLLPWLKDRGYQFGDLGKDTVSKSLREDPLTAEARTCLGLRQWAARMSVKKHETLLQVVGDDDNVRFIYQFAGASRTNRWAGRKVQTQNLPRTPKIIEEEDRLDFITRVIREGDYNTLSMWAPEPMEVIVGTVRSAFGTKDDEEFVVCDLSSIESVSIGWLANCERILRVFRSGLDVYKDFGSVWLGKPYEEITKQERGWSKPAMLGAGYRLSGGEIDKDGKRTGLWGYAENMGILDITQEQSHESVRVFREDYAPEVRQMWFDYERAAANALKTGRPHRVGPITFKYIRPFLCIVLPSGRHMFYYKPRLERITIKPKNGGEPYTRTTLTHMGVEQKTRQWKRLPTHGGKITENVVQAFARDVLCVGLMRAHASGFDIRGHVHDEIITLRKRGDLRYSVDVLRECMTAPISWAPDLPLGGAGWHGAFYKKD